MLNEEVELRGGLSEVLNNDARAAARLDDGSFLVTLAETNPLAEFLAIRDSEAVDLVLSAQCLNQTNVGWLVAGLGKNAHVSLLAVESLNGFTNTTGKTVVGQSLLQDNFQGFLFNTKVAL